MSTITNTMTVETQPAFGMPVGTSDERGRASVESFWMTVCDATTATQVKSAQVPASGNGRDRHVAALIKGAFPGTSVWRPPND